MRERGKPGSEGNANNTYCFKRWDINYDEQGRIYGYKELRDDYHYDFEAVLNTSPGKYTKRGRCTLTGVNHAIFTHVKSTNYNGLGQISSMVVYKKWINYPGPISMMEADFGHGTFHITQKYDIQGRTSYYRIYTKKAGDMWAGNDSSSWSSCDQRNYDFTYDRLGRNTRVKRSISLGGSYREETTENRAFDHHGRPIETYSTWTYRKGSTSGHGWDHDTDIKYNTEGQINKT